MVDHIAENIYLSDQADATDRGILESHDIVSVVTLTKQQNASTSRHHPLVDGENDQADFDRAVETVRDALDDDHNVLVHCAAGISRSSTAVTTALAAEQGLEFEEALQ